MSKPRRKAMHVWVMLVILPAMAGCDQENAMRQAISGITQEVLNLRQQVEDLRDRPYFVHITFQNLMPLALRDAKSGFVSLIIFPEEAKIEDWHRGVYGNCQQTAQAGGNAVCPETAFHKKLLDPLLSELAECASVDQFVRLEVVAFASSSVVTNLTEPQKEAIDRDVPEIDCACLCVSGQCYSEKFNLIAANLRAANAVQMLQSFIGARPIKVEHKPWKSHCEMVKHRDYDDRAPCGQYVPNKGLMNRRAEIRIGSLPGCAFFRLPDSQEASEGSA